MEKLSRRPALLPYARFYFIFLCLCFVYSMFVHSFLKSFFEAVTITSIVDFVGVKNADCLNLVTVLVLDLVQPFVIFRALQLDSQYWQGLYQSDLNEEVMGLWDVNREVVENLSQVTISFHILSIFYSFIHRH